MRELLDQIEALIEALTQPDDHPKRALFAVGDVARLLAAVRAVEGVVDRLGHVDGDVSPPDPWYYVSVGRKVVADEIRHALTEALEGER